MNGRYLVTGGAGFIGTAVVRALLERGNEVVVLDSGVAAGFAYLDGLDVRLIASDVRDSEAVHEALEDCSAVVHLAAQASVPLSIAEPLEDFDVNVTATVRLLDAARESGVRRFVFGSSNAVVAGHTPPVHEGLTPKAVAPYGAAKAAAESYLTAFREAYGMETVALRFANAYGPWSWHKRSVVAAFLLAYLSGGPLIVRGDGTQTRDFVHVNDIARLVLDCLDAPAHLVAGDVFQAGSARETSLIELAELIFDVGGGTVPIHHAAPTPGDVPRNVSDISKAERTLGFVPAVGLRDGLATTLDWFRAAIADGTRVP